MPPPSEITRLLAAASAGEVGAFERLVPLVYRELKAVAHRQLRNRRPGQTLDTTALVHEAYVKLVDRESANFENREHFLSVAAVAMRHVLVDSARRRTADKRGGGAQHVPVEDLEVAAGGAGVEARMLEVLAVDQALGTLALLNPRLSHLVELTYFAGFSDEEAARVLGVTDRTVRRDWRKARAFLFQAISGQAPMDPS